MACVHIPETETGHENVNNNITVLNEKIIKIQSM